MQIVCLYLVYQSPNGFFDPKLGAPESALVAVSAYFLK
jgi:hypothetical protein